MTILVTVYEAELLERLLLCTFMRCCAASSGFFGIQLVRAVGRRRTSDDGDEHRRNDDDTCGTVV